MSKQLLLIICFMISVGSVLSADTYANFIAGTVLNGDSSRAGNETNVIVRVDNGRYEGTLFVIEVDAITVPPFLKERGYFDTGDQLFFDNGASFTVEANNGTHYGNTSGVFREGGNGEFEGDEVKIRLDIPLNSTSTDMGSQVEDLIEKRSAFEKEFPIATGKLIKLVDSQKNAFNGLNGELESEKSYNTLIILIIVSIVSIAMVVALVRRNK